MENAERPQERSSSAAEGQTEERGQREGEDAASGAPAGWYPDAYDDSRQRYWDGEQWTDDFRPADGANDADGASVAEVEPKAGKLSRKEARAEKRRQSRERAEQRRRERLEKRRGRQQEQQRPAAAETAAPGQSESGTETGEDRSEGARELAEAIPSQFRSLHLIATLYSYLGYVVIVGGAIAVIAAAAGAGGSGAIVTFIVGAVAVAFYALLIFGIAAAIRLALAVEKNTRDTVELLKRDRDA
jgi:hypothetical protein